jgi:hypothetical protein
MAHLSPAEILLPDPKKIDTAVYPVIACDQFTSEPAFWQETARTVGDAPSTLGMILPEVYLSERGERIPGIHRNMEQYAGECLTSLSDSMILVRRVTSDGAIRLGLVGKIDLEDYDFKPGNDRPIRATEGTVTERIPPRVEIRRGAPLELPHVMLLFSDPEMQVIEPAYRRVLDDEPVYDIPLMQGAGHVTGWALSGEALAEVTAALDRIEANADTSLLYAVGDGNHSLASAKAYYEELKESLGEAAAEHPARYALVELVNLFDRSLVFRPIYRAVFTDAPDALLAALIKDAVSARFCPENEQNPRQSVTCILNSRKVTVTYLHGRHPLTVGTLQTFLDEYTAEHPEVTVDYIHGEASLASVIKEHPGSVGFLFDGMEKRELFPAVAVGGALPRKTFSMGEALDKRFYLEARRILPDA